MLNPSEAVARIQSIVVNSAPVARGSGVVRGNFYKASIVGAGVTGQITGQSTYVHCLVFRNDTAAVGEVNMPLALKDRIVVGPGTLVAIEFLIGGRVGINQSTQVVINSNRSVVDVNTALGRSFMNTVKLFLDANKLKQPLEIQTNGGTMAIKG